MVLIHMLKSFLKYGIIPIRNPKGSTLTCTITVKSEVLYKKMISISKHWWSGISFDCMQGLGQKIL